MLWRLVRLLALLAAIVFSLLAFPSITPMVLLFWVGVACLFRSKPTIAAAAILFSLTLLLIREPTNPWAIAYSIVALISAIVLAAAKSEHVRIRSVAIYCLLLAALAFSIERRFATTSSQGEEIGKPQSVACLGDSLTSGLPSIGGYPSHLRELTDLTVHDYGAEGITIGEAKTLLSEMKTLRPGTVVVELGGHDFLKRHSRRETKKALRQLVTECQETGAKVILCEIPRGFIIDPFYGLEREIAREMDLDLIPDSMIRRLVLFSPFAPPGMWLPEQWRYSDDGLHPNDRGNLMLARTVARFL